jgi:hypothetical protein
MNPNLAFEIVELALSLTKTQASGKLQQDAALAGVLLQIIEKAASEHSGPIKLALATPAYAKIENVFAKGGLHCGWFFNSFQGLMLSRRRWQGLQMRRSSGSSSLTR